MLPGLLCWTCRVYWVASLVLLVMCSGYQHVLGFKQLVNLAARLIELKCSQSVI